MLICLLAPAPAGLPSIVRNLTPLKSNNGSVEMTDEPTNAIPLAPPVGRIVTVLVALALSIEVMVIGYDSTEGL